MALNPYIYDIEVFAQDWIVIARKAEDDAEPIIIHNNNHAVKELFTKLEDKIFIGFNNKHYDDWMVQGMALGATNEQVKNHNDWIIAKHKNGWEYSTVQYKKRKFFSSDLRDDLPQNLSLKAIEANMGFSIVETGVDFNIQRALTDEELKLEIEYCLSDVNRTYDLYKARQSYLNTKLEIGRLKGIDDREALGLTNAKLTARFLDAEKKVHNDEFEYVVPDNLEIGKYGAVIEFFRHPKEVAMKKLTDQQTDDLTPYKRKLLNNRIKRLEEANVYQTELEMDVAGTPHKYAWGGLHGALPNYFIQQDDKHKILTVDVSSYYPSLMIQYGFVSRNIPSPKAFEDVYNTRIEAKNNGDPKNKPLKLVLNTTYGASKNKFNDLYDPRQANAVCITGQLFLTDLIDKLEVVQSFELIQSNTDGIVIRFLNDDEPQLESILQEWETRVRMTLERTVIKVIAQKDVNNYVMKKGESYIFEKGVKRVIDPDEDAIKTKGGYVSLFWGGNFQNNSMAVLNKAVVNYFMNGQPVEDTINQEKDFSQFQMVAKAGSTYQNVWHMVNGLKHPTQKVNRVFASTNENLGTVYKQKTGGNLEKIADLPEHCEVCNDNQDPSTLDRQFYIDLAHKRINDYMKKRGQKKMATTKTTTTRRTSTAKKTEPAPDISKMNLYEKLNELRSRWLDAKVQKTGVNTFSEYKYFELSDIIPVVQPLMKELHLVASIKFTAERAIMRVFDTDNVAKSESGLSVADFEEYESPMTTLTVKGMNAIQAMGAVETYSRRYLYMMMLDIVEEDAIDKGHEAETETVKSPAKPKPAAKTTHRRTSTTARKQAKTELTDTDGDATETQIKSMKAGLKKLRTKDADGYADYIKDTVVAIKKGMSKKAAEDKLIEIGDKVAE